MGFPGVSICIMWVQGVRFYSFRLLPGITVLARSFHGACKHKPLARVKGLGFRDLGFRVVGF